MDIISVLNLHRSRSTQSLCRPGLGIWALKRAWLGWREEKRVRACHREAAEGTGHLGLEESVGVC